MSHPQWTELCKSRVQRVDAPHAEPREVRQGAQHQPERPESILTTL